MAKYTFPEGFWWGSAASGPQTEGAAFEDGKGPNIWDYFYEIEPTRFFNNVGPTTASDFYHKYKEDIKLMKELGHNSFRMSITWSRLFPKGKGQVNQKAVEFYNKVIDEFIKNDVEPFVNLFHFDMPLELQNIGGWENREVVEAYANYAKSCFELFGDRVKRWITFNEPLAHVQGGYLHNFHYPNLVDFKRATLVAYHTALAAARAVEEFRKLRFKDAKIGLVLDTFYIYPRSENPADLKAAKMADMFLNKSFLEPCIKGSYSEDLISFVKEYNLMPEYSKDDLEIIKNNIIDYLGVNYYQPKRVKAKDYMPHADAPILPESFFDYYDMPGRRMNQYRGWEIYEKGIYDMLLYVKNNYNNIECYISENGMGVEGEERFIVEGQVQDDYRITFIKDHLKWVHKAIEEGCNVKGYHLWTFMDCWSWMNAYKNRYGLVSIDLESQKRTVKKSGYWFKELAENNGIQD